MARQIEIESLKQRIARLEMLAASRSLNSLQAAFIAGLKAQLSALESAA